MRVMGFVKLSKDEIFKEINTGNFNMLQNEAFLCLENVRILFKTFFIATTFNKI